MIPSLFGLILMLGGLVMIHYGLTETLLPLTPLTAPPAVGELGGPPSSIPAGSVVSTH